MSLKLFAQIVSRIFDFPLWVTILLSVALFNTGLSASQIKIMGPLLVVVDVIAPIVIFLILLRDGDISDIDITRRRERYKLFGFGSVASFISCFFVYFLGNHQFFALFATGFVITATLFLITLKWKISGHMIINCTGIYILSYLFEWQFLWLFALIPFVAFARFYLKKHSLWQITAGGVLGLLEPYVFLKLFNVI